MKITRIIYVFFLFGLFVPMAQQYFHFFNEEELSGFFMNAEKPDLDHDDFVNSSYQDKAEKYLNEHFGFRKTLLRLRNQVYFSFFSQSPAPEFYKGDQGYLFEKRYFDAYFGNDRVRPGKLECLTNDIRTLQDTLLAHGITLLTVVAPSKAFFYPEYVPESFDLTPADTTTNYDAYMKLALDKGINVIDFNADFIRKKSSSPYPLYTKNGTHWTYYAAALAFDSVLGVLGRMTHKPFPRVRIDHCDTLLNDLAFDNEVATGMNLLFRPDGQKMIKPSLKYEINNGYLPDVVGITDSYYGILESEGLLKSCFRSPDYWFYYHDFMPHEKYDTLLNKKDFLSKEIMGRDAIILMCTPHNIHELSWGFVQDALKLFDKTTDKPYSYDFYYERNIFNSQKAILNDAKWLEGVLERTMRDHMNPDTVLYINAQSVADDKRH